MNDYKTANLLISQCEDEVDRLTEQRDELLKALKDCLESLKRLPNKDGAWRLTCIRQAEAAIARADRSAQ